MKRLYKVWAALAVMLWVTVPAAAAGGYSDQQEKSMEGKRSAHVQVPETFGSSRLYDWHVLDGRNLVIELDNGTRYKASLMSYCSGLRFTDVLGFSTQGPFELDDWTTLYLPDGERCYIKELTPYKEEQASEQPS